MGYAPQLIFVPPALETAAENAMKAAELRQIATGNGSQRRDRNLHDPQPVRRRVQDRRQRPTSARTTTRPAPRAAIPPGTHLGDQGQVPVWELLFLDGNQAPVIESSQMEFSHLGIVHRGYHAYRSGVPSNPAASSTTPASDRDFSRARRLRGRRVSPFAQRTNPLFSGDQRT